MCTIPMYSFDACNTKNMLSYAIYVIISYASNI